MGTANVINSPSAAATINVPNLLTLGEAADILGTSPATVRRMVSRGELRAFKFGGRNLRIDGASIPGALEPVAAWMPAA